ncbi:MAG: methyltransferase domain-containing protein [Chitinivibrionales bacterium]|nr:methyltransferase domain-containing protein [Chitinivibrionales bacterium]MBD3395911.1 methyltransferase domain-containing protein [Chitinivibrionales bacterium]
MHLLHRLASYGLRETKRLSSRGPVETCRRKYYTVRELLWRRKFGMDTLRLVEPEDAGLDSTQCHYHSPTHYIDFKKAMKRVRVRPAQDVFVDYGSGQGAVVVMAAMYPFKKVVGVEISEEFNASARAHIDRALPKLLCRDIELVVSDAAAYRVPDDVTVVFLYNPFSGDVLDKALANLHESWKRKPRRITIVYKNPEHAAALDTFPGWVRETGRFTCFWGHPCVIYQTGGEPVESGS